MARPTLFYVRHGETDWNTQGRLQGQHDIPLNENGRAQAARCGEILADLLAREARDATSLDYLASPLRRARTSMELVRAGLELAPEDYRVEPLLTEISFGQWEGCTLAELRRIDTAMVDARESDKWDYVPPGGESYRMLAKRMGVWYGQLARDAVVVAHGGTLRALTAHLGLVPAEIAPSYAIGQGVVYVIRPDSMSRYG